MNCLDWTQNVLLRLILKEDLPLFIYLHYLLDGAGSFLRS